MFRRRPKRPMVEHLEARYFLSGTYVVNEVPDIALTQPYVNYFLRATPNGPPLEYDFGLGPEINQEAFLDTGTSGMIFSKTTTDTYEIEHKNTDGSLSYTGGNPVIFTDIGISGGQDFQVSEPIYTAVASENEPNIDDPNNYSAYNQSYGPLVTELNPIDDPAADFLGGTDIFGMPVMMNKVVVMDTRPFYNGPTYDGIPLGNMSSFIYNPGTPYDPNNTDLNPGIPTDNMLQVRLSNVDFSPYTSIFPTNASPPVLDPNPMIGPNPLPGAPPSSVPPISLSFGESSTTGSFLFDTGAEVSFLSQAVAAQLHVHYAPGTYLTDNPQLVDDNGNPIPNQSTVPLEGTDPNHPVSASEFFLDSLTLQTVQGTPIRLQNVPIVVLDVGLTDPNTGEPIVLDGDFGANMLLASMDGGTQSAFNWITFDQQNGLLSFQPAGTISPGTASVVSHKIFYNNSAFDGNNAAVNAADDTAIAPDKVALLAGQAPGFSNFTSYSKGINGIMVDIANLPFNPTASDFTFAVGNSNNASLWSAAPQPTSIVVRPGAGVNGSSRVEVTWADGAIKNEWLQVIVKADANTGLAAPDTFFFGNLVAASGHGTLGTSYTISATDVTAAQNDLHTFLNPAMLTDTQDYNRDGRVDATDQVIARYANTQNLVMLNSAITGAAPAAAASALLASTSSSSSAPSINSTPGTKLTTTAHPRNEQSLLLQLRKQRIIAALQQRLHNTSTIHNARQRAKIQAQIRQQIATVRSYKTLTPFLTPIL